MSYPTTLDDSASLPIAADEKVTFLTLAALVGDTTFTVNSTTGFPTSGVLETPSGELVAYTGVTATTFTGLTRGYSGTVAQPYPVDTTIKLVLSSDYVNNPRTSLIEVEKKIGIGASNASSAATGHAIRKNADGTTSWQADAGLGYTAEDVANKATDFSVINDTKYPTTKAVDDLVDAFAASVTTALAGKQPLDSDLTAIAALSTTAYGRALLELANAGALRTAAGLVIGTDVQAYDGDLAAIAGLSPADDDVIQRKAGAWVNRTIAQLKTDLGHPTAKFARVYNNANLAITTGSPTMLTFNSERDDTDTFHSTVTNTSRLTIPVAGVYSVVASVEFAASAAGTFRQVQIILNGTTTLASLLVTPNAAANRLFLPTQYRFAVSDYIEVQVFHDAGVNQNVLVSANYSPEFMISYVGP